MKPKVQKRIEAVQREIKYWGGYKNIPSHVRRQIYDTLCKLPSETSFLLQKELKITDYIG